MVAIPKCQQAFRANLGHLILLCLFSNSPGVLTVVELNMTSSFVLTEGLKPWGVCACAMPTKVAKRTDDWMCITKRIFSTWH